MLGFISILLQTTLIVAELSAHNLLSYVDSCWYKGVESQLGIVLKIVV